MQSGQNAVLIGQQSIGQYSTTGYNQLHSFLPKLFTTNFLVLFIRIKLFLRNFEALGLGQANKIDCFSGIFLKTHAGYGFCKPHAQVVSDQKPRNERSSY